MQSFLLDTGLLLGLARGSLWARRVLAQVNRDNPEAAAFTSVICHGEILALAKKNDWGEKRLAALEQILLRLPRLGIDPAVLDAYARIDAWTHGKSVDAPGNATPPKPAVSMEQNDLWIAATAHAHNAVLLSTDKDFAHLNGVWFDFDYIDQTAA